MSMPDIYADVMREEPRKMRRKNNVATRSSAVVRTVKAAETVNLDELSKVAQLFRATVETQETLLNGINENIREMLETLSTQSQQVSDLLQILTTQSEQAEKMMERLLSVTLALTKAVRQLETLPPGSAIPSSSELARR